MQAGLTQGQRQFVGTVRELTRTEFKGRGTRWMDGTFPWENMRRLAEIGVLGEVGVQTRIIAHHAPEHMRRRILPAVCAGKMILSICMTEPHAGTDAANCRPNVALGGGTSETLRDGIGKRLMDRDGPADGIFGLGNF